MEKRSAIKKFLSGLLGQIFRKIIQKKIIVRNRQKIVHICQFNGEVPNNSKPTYHAQKIKGRDPIKEYSINP